MLRSSITRLAPSRSAKIGFAYAPVTACMASNVNLKSSADTSNLKSSQSILYLFYIRDHYLAICEAYNVEKIATFQRR